MPTMIEFNDAAAVVVAEEPATVRRLIADAARSGKPGAPGTLTVLRDSVGADGRKVSTMVRTSDVAKR